MDMADVKRKAIAVALLAIAAPARAQPQFAVVFGPAALGDRDAGARGAVGGGADFLMLGYEGGTVRSSWSWFAQLGGLAAIGRAAPRHRDVIDVHARGGLLARPRAWLEPFVAGGADALQITSYDGDAVARGTTLGVSLTAGVLGRLSRHVEYQLTAGWTDAIVPGTGAELDAFVEQIGLGFRMSEYGRPE